MGDQDVGAKMEWSEWCTKRHVVVLTSFPRLANDKHHLFEVLKEEGPWFDDPSLEFRTWRI